MIERTEFESGTFYLGDCFEVMAGLKAGSVDMVLNDPPYGTTSCSWDSVLPLEETWAAFNRICPKHAAMVFTAGQPFTSALVMSNPRNYAYPWYWKKAVGSGFQNAKKQPLRMIEEIAVFYRSRPTYNPQGLVKCDRKKVNKIKAVDSIVGGSEGAGGLRTVGNEWTQEFTNYPKNVLEFNGVGKGKQHPTQKPVALFEYLIRTYTNEGQFVLDNTAGSGTTAIAAMNAGRRWICIEKDETYYRAAVERVRKHEEKMKEAA